MIYAVLILLIVMFLVAAWMARRFYRDFRAAIDLTDDPRNLHSIVRLMLLSVEKRWSWEDLEIMRTQIQKSLRDIDHASRKGF